MKCEEVKNLIIEATNLHELLEETDAKSHINSCKSCQDKFQYEKKIRSSFLSIAEESPPISLAKSILAIQDSHETVSIWDKIQSFFFSFTFKVSFASCLTGFLLALAVSHYDHSAIMHENTLLKAESKKIENKSFAMKKRKSKLALQEVPKVKTDEKDVVKPYSRQEPLEDQTHYSIADEDNNWSQLPEKNTFAKKNETKIPEMTYSIQKAKSNNNAQKMELAMAPRPVISKSLRKARTVVCKENSIVRETKQLFGDSFDCKISKSIDKESEELIVDDSRATKIEHLISSNNITVATGPINVKHWAVQGIITAQECEKLLPPYGKYWHIEMNGSQVKVLLKENLETK